MGRLSNSTTIHWLKVDCKPLKQAISTWVSKWSYTYTEYLLSDLTSKISNLLNFVNEAQVPPGLGRTAASCCRSSSSHQIR